MNDVPIAHGGEIVLRPLDTGDLRLYRALRLRALQDAPKAFGSSFEEESTYPDEVFARRLIQANGNIFFGAFKDGELVGTAGVYRHERRSEQHRGTMVGVYVARQARGLRLATALVQKIIDHAEEHFVVLDAKVVATNESAKRIYHALGFRTYGVEPKSFVVAGEYLDEELIAIDFSDPAWAAGRVAKP